MYQVICVVIWWISCHPNEFLLSSFLHLIFAIITDLFHMSLSPNFYSIVVALLLYSLSFWPAMRFSSFSIDNIASNSSVKFASIFPMSFSTETLECSLWLVSFKSVCPWLALGDVADDRFVGVLSAVVDFDWETSSNGTFAAFECGICWYWLTRCFIVPALSLANGSWSIESMLEFDCD